MEAQPVQCPLEGGGPVQCSLEGGVGKELMHRRIHGKHPRGTQSEVRDRDTPHPLLSSLPVPGDSSVAVGDKEVLQRTAQSSP